MSFSTSYWQGKIAGTDIPERVLSPAEVYVINDKYLKLHAAFHARGHAEEEQNVKNERKN